MFTPLWSCRHSRYKFAHGKFPVFTVGVDHYSDSKKKNHEPPSPVISAGDLCDPLWSFPDRRCWALMTQTRLTYIFVWCLFLSRCSHRGFFPPLLPSWPHVHQCHRRTQPQQGGAWNVPGLTAGMENTSAWCPVRACAHEWSCFGYDF